MATVISAIQGQTGALPVSMPPRRNIAELELSVVRAASADSPRDNSGSDSGTEYSDVATDGGLHSIRESVLSTADGSAVAATEDDAKSTLSRTEHFVHQHSSVAVPRVRDRDRHGRRKRHRRSRHTHAAMCRAVRARAFYLVWYGRAVSTRERCVWGAVVMSIVLGTFCAMSETVLYEYERTQAVHDALSAAGEAWVTFVLAAELFTRAWSLSLANSRKKGMRIIALAVDAALVLPLPLSLLLGMDATGRAVRDGEGGTCWERLLYFLRVLRIVKLARYSRSVRMIADVVRQKRQELSMAVTLGGVVAIVLSVLVFACEHDRMSRFSDMMVSLWWSVVTLTTVGYGDITPETPCGRMVGSAGAFMGIGLFTLARSTATADMLQQFDGDLADAVAFLCKHWQSTHVDK